jgi:hypothetical protein
MNGKQLCMSSFVILNVVFNSYLFSDLCGVMIWRLCEGQSEAMGNSKKSKEATSEEILALNCPEEYVEHE